MPVSFVKVVEESTPGNARVFVEFIGCSSDGNGGALNAFVRDIKGKYADFQRPAGIRLVGIKRDQMGQYLRGFEHWDG